MSKKTEKIAQEITSYIETKVAVLNDKDYLEVLDEVEAWCDGGSTAKREELENRK